MKATTNKLAQAEPLGYDDYLLSYDPDGYKQTKRQGDVAALFQPFRLRPRLRQQRLFAMRIKQPFRLRVAGDHR